MGRFLTLALVQMKPEIGELYNNLEKVIQLTVEAAQKGAQFVIFPELALTGYHQGLLGDNLHKLALSVDDEPIRQLAQTAYENNVYLVFGFIEKRAIPGVLYNSIAICTPQGEVQKTYAKSHLFSGEKLHFCEGPEFGVVETKHCVIGPMICMDVGYPEVARILCLQGAELLIAPSAWVTQDEDMWPLNLRARALDNQVFVAGVNRVGDEGELHYIGKSALIDPRGHVMDILDDQEGMLVAKIDLDRVVEVRQEALFWIGRRPDMYGDILNIY